MNREPGKNAIPAHVRTQLNAVHQALLAVHKELLDYQRARYERQSGPIKSPGEALQLAINDSSFAFLRPLTALIIQADELMASKTPNYPEDTDAIFAECLRLVKPDAAGDAFQQEYFQAIQESPEVASAHGQWKSLSQQLRTPKKDA